MLDMVKMKAAGQLAAEILSQLTIIIEDDISTLDIDNYVKEKLALHKARSGSFGYYGFTGHLCTSINDVVCHGIPNKNVILHKGDFINTDLALELDGHYGDTSRCFMIGKVESTVRDLVDTTYEAMWAAIEICRPGLKVNEIGRTIEKYLKQSKKQYGIVRRFCGHGIGNLMHQDPDVPHYYDPHNDFTLTAGICITIEPMINGSANHGCRILADGWTAKTLDGACSAQWEHTIYITETGYEVMTYNDYDLKKGKNKIGGN